MISIVDAIKDPNLFRPFLEDKHGSIQTWSRWRTVLRAVYGLPIPERRHKLIRRITGRNPEQFPEDGFRTVLCLTGRRSGKSRIAAIVAAYESALAGNEDKLAPGEVGYVPIISPTKSQSRIVRDYVRGVFNSTDLLRREIVKESREGFELRNGVRIEIVVSDWRTVRGFTLLAAVVDEACFLGLDAESKVRNDTELIQAIKPSLATSGGKLIAISSPYAKRGWCYRQWENNFGNDRGRTLVINCPSRSLNPTLPQSVVDDALADDPASARSEYLGEWRDDISAFLPLEVIQRLVVEGRKELLHDRTRKYYAFADLSGGRSDDAALAIATQHGSRVVIAKLIRYRAPFGPREVIRMMCEELKRYRLNRVTGDNYAAEFVSSEFESNGIYYRKSAKNKSALYLELLPRLCSGDIELLDDPALIDQLASLERRTRSGGKDIVDHPPGKHDDLANVVAGVVEVLHTKRFRVGAIN